MKISHMLLAFSAVLATAPMIAIADDNRSAESRSTLEKSGDYISDAALTTKVKSALAVESNLSTFDISVESTDGIVTLSGEVDNDSEVELASEVVENLDGVKGVNNKLTSR